MGEEIRDIEAEREKSIETLASEYHEDWRKTRKREDGSFEPRVKETKDPVYIARKGTNQVDIANTSFENLPKDWQQENRAAATVVVEIIDNAETPIDLSNKETYNQVGDIIHKKWLERNTWAVSDEKLGKPFAELPEEEKEKDIRQMEIAQEVLA